MLVNESVNIGIIRRYYCSYSVPEHLLFWATYTLGSRVRISNEAWMLNSLKMGWPHI